MCDLDVGFNVHLKLKINWLCVIYVKATLYLLKNKVLAKGSFPVINDLG